MQTGNLLVYGNAIQTATTFFQVAKGTAAQRPTAAAAMIRYNTDTNRLEHALGSTAAWSIVGQGDGSVTSVTLTSASTGITVSNATVTTNGTITLNLAGELAGLNALSTNGLVVRTAAGTYTGRAVTANTAAGSQGVTVSNGDGVAGAPTVGFSISGLTAAGSVSSTTQVVVYDGTNNLRATVGQISAAVTGFTKAARTSFTNATLSSGILTFTHNLGTKYNEVSIYDNNDKKVQPDDITATSTSVATVDLTSFGTLTGTWNIVAIGG